MSLLGEHALRCIDTIHFQIKLETSIVLMIICDARCMYLESHDRDPRFVACLGLVDKNESNTWENLAEVL